MPEFIGRISIPVYVPGERELAGLRMEMLAAGPHSLQTGTGLGNDGIWVTLATGEKLSNSYVVGRDILHGIARLVDHPDANRLPHSDNAELPIGEQAHGKSDA